MEIVRERQAVQSNGHRLQWHRASAFKTPCASCLVASMSYARLTLSPICTSSGASRLAENHSTNPQSQANYYPVSARTSLINNHKLVGAQHLDLRNVLQTVRNPVKEDGSNVHHETHVGRVVNVAEHVELKECAHSNKPTLLYNSLMQLKPSMTAPPHVDHKSPVRSLQGAWYK
eukprot:5827935-Amphidinium_carterae.1